MMIMVCTFTTVAVSAADCHTGPRVQESVAESVADVPGTGQLARPVLVSNRGVLSSTQGHRVPRRAAVVYDVHRKAVPVVASSTLTGCPSQNPKKCRGKCRGHSKLGAPRVHAVTVCRRLRQRGQAQVERLIEPLCRFRLESWRDVAIQVDGRRDGGVA